MKENEIEIYAEGLVACSVCVPKGMTREEIMNQVNLENPTGIDSKWIITKDNFQDGKHNPSICENNKERLHYLLNC